MKYELVKEYRCVFQSGSHCVASLLLSFFIMPGLFSGPQALAAITAVPPSSITNASSTTDNQKDNDTNSLLVDVDTVGQRNSEGYLLIDVRDAKEFKKVRIPGSINLPLFHLKTKSFLKSKKIVLLDEGYSHNLLLREAKMLREEEGFNAVFVLSGGLHGWYRSDRKLAGDFLEAEQLSFIQPDKFFQQRNLEHWTTVVVGKNDLQSTPLFPKAITVPFSQDQSKFLAVLSNLKREQQSPLSSVLVITEDGNDYAEIEQAVRKAGLTNVFYLKGGLRGYGKFIEQQALLAHPKKMTTGGNTCPTCPQKK